MQFYNNIMEKLLLFLLVTLVSFPTFSQDVKLKFYVEDAIGRTDTVIFGLNDNSSLGIDSSLGEVNIFGSPWDSLDIRVIQRDSSNYNCFKSPQCSSCANLYYTDNIDSKVNFRPFGTWAAEYDFFEIFVSALNYPVTVQADFSEFQNDLIQGWSEIYLLSEDCGIFDIRSTNGYDSIRTIFLLVDSSFKTLKVHFQHEVGIEDFKEFDRLIVIYPNPAEETLFINLNNTFTNKATVSVHNTLGQIVSSTTSSDRLIEIDVRNMKKGIYFLEIIEPNRCFWREFIKQ